MPPISTKNLQPPVPSHGMVRLEEIVASLEGHGRKAEPEFLRSVYDFSSAMHRDQVRRSGEPYLIHPLNVAWLLADLKFDQTCVAVGLLHDVLEDTLTTREVLEAEFGQEIAELVDGVTKISRHEYVRRDEAQAETFRKMILASAKDIRVILVKLADRLHNMQTLEHLPAESRRRISRETLEIYAPIAHRLGMARVKGDLEDLAFFYLYPHQFAELHSKIAEKMKLAEAAIQRIHERLAEILEAAGIDAEISFRVKRLYSIYEKLRRQGIDISQLYDYLAFRIVTPELKDTYAAFGVVHQAWRPIPGRFKDYIAMPKRNFYQSLHTTMVGDEGQPFEVQIRTREMDLIAEEGIAAHWRYKEGKAEPRQSDRSILWLRQLLEWQQEIQDPRTFLTALKVDLYPDEVYVFTPRGEVLSFPRGATPLDFAYRVHTDLGHHCAGSRVNGKLVPLRTPLVNGDMVEILTNPNRNPSRDWLNFATTSRAKSKIRHWLNTQQTERATEIGRRLLDKELRKYGIASKKLLDSPALAAYLQNEGMAKLDDLYSRVGFGKIEPRQALSRVLGDELPAEPAAKPGRIRQAVSKILPFGPGPITVKGHGDLLAYLAKCCNPLPGEEIVGYITRGRGVSVHSVDCPNVKNLLYHPEREIEVQWDRERDSLYQVSLLLATENQPGLLARLTEVITKADSNITQIEAETHETGRASISIICELRHRKQLEKLMRDLRAISGVLRVDRQMNVAGGRSEAEALP
ncbi:MAG TPA: bifunctional (p)ppGpp synthetase/guanosine-3',5'-bis(diphosphate) 3'-pyrophosphohydrolase [Thermoanaerobaculia bacterium]|jgi:guanosine-3',5'-bis(diphosphate) 3'-pyrophosphohydrolase|nr:bifunctional (p)ppGpp synthetase/guanosine-3',5'-bis(diphosphate) 3'-pyrophosphohydrolase [Thermoanaerobaculia bacterium]